MSPVNCRNVARLVFVIGAVGTLIRIRTSNNNGSVEVPMLASEVNTVIPAIQNSAIPIRNVIFPPPSDEEINFSGYSRYPSEELESVDFQPSDTVKILERILRTLSPGYFLECGANDGVFISNTLWLERKLNWTGLLIEPDPNAFAILKNIRRNAWISDGCVSNSLQSYNASFYLSKYSEASGMKKSEYYQATTEIVKECFPLYDFLQALNVTVIDFFSLDVEGNELDILQTIPFDKVEFKVLTIEYLFVPGKRQVLKDFMASKGYIFFRSIVADNVGDCVFLHPSVIIPEEEFTFVGYEDQDKYVAQRP